MTAGIIFATLVGASVGGFISGLSGFAFGMAALSIWIWSLDPHILAPMVVFGSLVAQLVSFGVMRRGLVWARLAPFLIGGAAGVPAGFLLLQAIDPTRFRAVVGAVLVAYCSFMLLAPQFPPVRRGGRLADALVGIVGGTMGGLAGLSGPAPTIWCALRGWDKEGQRAVFQTFNLAMHVIVLTVYAFGGLLTAEMGPVFALMLPAVLLSTWLGATLYRRLSDLAFRRMVLSLLLMSGVVLLTSALLR